jgi:hypothetical protein
MAQMERKHIGKAAFWEALAFLYVLPPDEEKQWKKRGSFGVTKLSP